MHENSRRERVAFGVVGMVRHGEAWRGKERPGEARGGQERHNEADSKRQAARFSTAPSPSLSPVFFADPIVASFHVVESHGAGVMVIHLP